MNIVPGSDATVMRGWRPEEDYVIQQVYAPETFGTDSSIAPAINDLMFAARTTTGTTVKNDIVVLNNLTNRPVVLSSDTPDICVVDPEGHVRRVADGACVIRACGQTGERLASQTITVNGGNTIYDAVTARSDGSLRAYLYNQQLAALSGVTPGSAAQRAAVNPNNYVTNGGIVAMSGGTYGTVNTGNFLRTSRGDYVAPALDILDEILAASGQSSVEWRAWISPHHFLTWRGHGSSDGATWRSIEGEIIVEYRASGWTGSLCKLLPEAWREWMPALPDGSFLLSDEIPCWGRLYNTYMGGGTDPAAERRWVVPGSWGYAQMFDDARAPYQRLNGGTAPQHITGGDSGSPVWCVVNGVLVPLGHVSSGGIFGSLFYADYRAEIDAAMNALATANSDPAAGTYAVQTADLSGFTSYP